MARPQALRPPLRNGSLMGSYDCLALSLQLQRSTNEYRAKQQFRAVLFRRLSHKFLGEAVRGRPSELASFGQIKVVGRFCGNKISSNKNKEMGLFNKLNYKQKYHDRKMYLARFPNASDLERNSQLTPGLATKALCFQKDFQPQIDSPVLRHHHSEASTLPRLHSSEIQGQEGDPPKPFQIFPVNQRTHPNFLNPFQLAKVPAIPIEEKQNFRLISSQYRKYSESNIIQENWEAESEQDEIERRGAGENRGPPLRLRSQRNQTKSRKGSCNLDMIGFLTRPIRKNSDLTTPKGELKCERGLMKRKSLGWDENSGFQFGSPSQSEDKQRQQLSPALLTPKKMVRKHSENLDSPTKKGVPSFLTALRHHRSSLNSIETAPQKQSRKWRIADFVILKEMGKGSFGRVVLAIEKASRLICAIKIMAKREIQENNMQEQLGRQLKIQLYISHPNIVKVYGFFDDLLHCYIIMEGALDGHLSEHLKKSVSPLPQSESAHLLHQICSAVTLLHTSSIIHRDLKPDNVLLHEGVVKLCDFGWSVHRDSNLRTTFCGTPAYLCPQILVGDSYDESVDIWNIGVILYFMFYRTNPFRITSKDQLVNIINQPINFKKDVEISLQAKDFIEVCLSKRAIERPNIRELSMHQFVLNAHASREQRF